MNLVYFLMAGAMFFNSVSHAGESSPKVNLLWVPTNRTATNAVLKKEFEIEVYGSTFVQVKPVLEVTPVPIDPAKHPNPLGITDKDFNTGWYLSRPDEPQGAPPAIDPADAVWFDQLIAGKQLPDVFEIGGHHVISEGWHSHDEHHFLFHPTFVQALERFPAARLAFDHVKLGIPWGCNTMTDLEPRAHAGDFPGAKEGDYLSPAQIENFYHSGQRLRMIGLTSPGGEPMNNSLEFYKQRLASEYGPRSEHFEYTRKKSEETCQGPYQDCAVTDLERVMPERILFDGTHRYNEPWRMKRIFRNAYLVLGFSSASPSEETRALILQKTIDRARKALNAGKTTNDLSYIRNVLFTITGPDTPVRLRKQVIEEVRKQWTITTYEMNRGRPSGSITPAFPDLDKNGVFNVVVSKDTPAYAPYEER